MCHGYRPWMCLSCLYALGLFDMKPDHLVVTGLGCVCHGYTPWVFVMKPVSAGYSTGLGCVCHGYVVWVRHETRSFSWLHPMSVFVMVTSLGCLCHETRSIGWLQALYMFVMVTCFECVCHEARSVGWLHLLGVHLCVSL